MNEQYIWEIDCENVQNVGLLIQKVIDYFIILVYSKKNNR